MDIGSRVDGFVAHVAVFRSIEVCDIRPLKSEVPNVLFVQFDAMRGAPPSLSGKFDSVSCLHALEHFGLGRYGDEIDVEGHYKGLATLADLLTPAGKLYLSVPIGPKRIEFNAHRVFSLSELLSLVNNRFVIERLSYVDDAGDLHENVQPSGASQESFGCLYGCAILELKKR